MNNIKIFLDLDAVIINCTKGFATKFNLKIPKKSYLNYGYFDEYWTNNNRKLLDYDFWSNLELYPWSKNLIKLVEKYDADFRFLTACVREESCYSGKYANIKKLLGGKYANKIIMCCEDKSFAAGPNKILIDDKNDNCDLWLKSNGIFYLWKERTEDMIEETDDELRKLEKFLDLKMKKNKINLKNILTGNEILV